jgi:hypothetical protein
VCGEVRTRLGLDTCLYQTPAWVLFKVRVCSVLGSWDPFVGGPDPIRGGGGGSGLHTRRSQTNLGGPDCKFGGLGPTLGV